MSSVRIFAMIAMAAVGFAAWQSITTFTSAATRSHICDKEQRMVRVRVMNDQGELVGPVESPRVVKSDAEWKQQLTPEQFHITRSQGTEKPFCGTLLDNKKEGVYTCVSCGLPLFTSDAKFKSGTGWPSFFQPIAEENIQELTDNAYGMQRTEILCQRCDAHLGHVFNDGPRPTGLRYCLNSESMSFTQSDQLKSLADPAANKPLAAAPPATATAVFAGGCFWCTEAAFEQLKGVTEVVSGYAGGTEETANYQAVCSGHTAHAEVIQITYDPARITFDDLLNVFFDAHDPTQLNQQGADVGPQYRSAIFFANEQEKQAARAKISQLNARKKYPQSIVTRLEPLEKFYPAERYHQDYVQNNPLDPYVVSQALPKANKVCKTYPDLIKKTAK